MGRCGVCQKVSDSSSFFLSLRNGTRKLYDVECDIPKPTSTAFNATQIDCVLNGQLLMRERKKEGRV